MLALEAPLLKLTLAAGALAAIGAFAPVRHHHEMHKLVLHACSRTDAIYASVWARGTDVSLDVDPHHLKVMQFETTSPAFGCLWQGTETLMPNGDHYDYTYTDKLVSCGPHPIPAEPTPRSGTVTIE
jgi:hypothetical protein